MEFYNYFDKDLCEYKASICAMFKNMALKPICFCRIFTEQADSHLYFYPVGPMFASETPRVIGQVHEALAISAGDIDGDGDQDLVVVSLNNGGVVWFNNTDSKGNFGPQIVIASGAEVIQMTSVLAVDIDSDGDIDVLAVNFAQNTIIWFENLDGKGEFDSEAHVVGEHRGGFVGSLVANDFDNDGDKDILVGSGGDQSIYLFENLNQGGTCRTIFVANTTGGLAKSLPVCAGGFNRDNNSVIIVAASHSGKVSIVENLSL